ncbi:hypothetical protein Pmani_026401 [Petrolisthes manimaculis]|uniref:Uncharacterized protein n=1 Tax=Petrolisthes manimaculis TaxID=1843537 RepID=A0AAE1U051_9EUCA|nr:hypothetical protein Pmani_026401 [Petrolisthes manimaculis]
MSCGDFSVKGEVIKSLAPSMDIQVPYNIERLLYLFTNRDRERTFVASDDKIKSAMKRINMWFVPTLLLLLLIIITGVEGEHKRRDNVIVAGHHGGELGLPA